MTGRRWGLVEQFLSDCVGILDSREFRQALKYGHHGAPNTIGTHCARAAWAAFRVCRFFRVSPEHEREAVRAALCHDLFGYDWYAMPGAWEKPWGRERARHCVRHAGEAARVAGRAFGLNDRERDAVLKHMFPVCKGFPKYSVSWVVTLCDKLASARDLGAKIAYHQGLAVRPPIAIRFLPA